MYIFEITIQRGQEDSEGCLTVVKQSEPGTFLTTRNESVFNLNHEQLLAQVTPHAYGTLLGQALFYGDLHLAFRQALAKSQADRSERDDAQRFSYLHVLLYIEDPELKQLRWERLCAPFDANRWDFLAQNQQTPFSLYLPSATDRRFPFIGRQHLRALLVVANPQNLDQYGLAEFDAGRAVSTIKTALGEIPTNVLATVDDAVGLPTLTELCKCITEEPYTLLHIVAHGGYKSDTGETTLYLANEENRVAPVSGTDLIKRLQRLQGDRGLPHFTFLSTCDSAKPEAEGALGGLGQRLVRELGMPAVLAMTERISIPTAEALAKAFYTQLRKHGKVDQALAEAYAKLVDRYDSTVPALYSRLGGQPLFIETPDRELTDKEIEYGLSRLKMPASNPSEGLLLERAPILLDVYERQENELRRMLKTDRSALITTTRQAWDQAMFEVNGICAEVLEMNFRALALGKAPPAYDARRPFPGLVPFKAEDREFFFGREELVKELANRLEQDNFLAILGASGSGKSSLVLAGVVPALQERHPGLQVLYMKPSHNPLQQFQEKRIALENSRQQAMAEAKNGSSLLFMPILVVDQFEELFTLCNDKTERQLFLDHLLNLAGFSSTSNFSIQEPASQPVAPTARIIITMRADFWGECAPYRLFKAAMLKHQELLSPMNTQELRSAMEQQAERVGLHFEADLSNIILRDVQGEPGAMPLLQHALQVLWQRRHGRWLLTKEYNAFGGVREAIAQTADNLYRTLTESEKEHLRNIFIRLTRLDEDTEFVQGEGRRDTRRRVPLAELIPADSDRRMVRNLVTQLANERLIVTTVKKQQEELNDEIQEKSSESDRDNNVEVEVAHEALIREWPRLRSWLDENREGIRLQQQLSLTAQDWAAQGRDVGDLYRGQRLENAEAWVEAHASQIPKLDKEFLGASRAQVKVERKQAVRRRWIIGGLIFFSVLLAGAAILFFNNAQQSQAEAQSSQATAEAQTEVAQQSRAAAEAERADQELTRRRILSRELTASAFAVLSNNREISTLLALEALAQDNGNKLAANVLKQIVGASADEEVETLQEMARSQLQGRWWTEAECQEYLGTDCTSLISVPSEQ